MKNLYVILLLKRSTPDETFVRIIIESDEWPLIFPVGLLKCKCIVPIKKRIFKEVKLVILNLKLLQRVIYSYLGKINIKLNYQKRLLLIWMKINILLNNLITC